MIWTDLDFTELSDTVSYYGAKYTFENYNYRSIYRHMWE